MRAEARWSLLIAITEWKRSPSTPLRRNRLTGQNLPQETQWTCRYWCLSRSNAHVVSSSTFIDDGNNHYCLLYFQVISKVTENPVRGLQNSMMLTCVIIKLLFYGKERITDCAAFVLTNFSIFQFYTQITEFVPQT